MDRASLSVAVRLSRLACLALAYFALAGSTLLLTRFDGGVAFLWIATSFLIALLSVSPKAEWASVLVPCGIGAAIASATFGLGPVAAGPMAIVGMVEAALTVLILRRWLGHANYFESVEGIAAFAVVAGGLIPVATGIPGAAIAASLTGADYGMSLLRWATAHGLGTIIFTPIFVLVLRGELRASWATAGTARKAEGMALLTLVGVTAFFVFYQTHMPLLFLPMLPMMAATVRIGRMGAAGASVLLTIVGGVLTLRGHGPVYLIHTDDGGRLQFFQFYIATATMLVLPVAALLKNRKELMARLIQQEARYRLLADHASDAILNLAIDGTILYASPSVREVGGFEPEELIGRNAQDMVIEEDRQRAIEIHRRALAEPSRALTLEYRAQTNLDGICWFEARTRAITDDGGHVTGVVMAIRDVSERKELEFALGKARHRAEAAVAAKSAFLANMSHEIRTPMNGVIGFTEILLAGRLTGEQRRQVKLIADSGQAMMRLLNDILDISKVEAGQMKVHSELFDLPHALRACLKLITPVAAQKGLEVVLEMPLDLPRTVLGDGLRLRQIVLNLLGNAVKFTQGGGVTLRVRAMGKTDPVTVMIEVKDTGIGIPSDRQAAIFEQFVQADTSVAPRYGGTGLGLSISLKLAQLMGGDLQLQSEVGKGTSFFLTLPFAVSDKALPKSSAEKQAGPARSDAADRPRVLVAEDHDVNQLLMGAMLKQLGYRYGFVQNGVEALAELARGTETGDPYAIVLMDMQMPEMDGIEAANRIRWGGTTPEDLPILCLTANAYADDAAACMKAGMQAHLPKPVKLADLDAALRRWLPSDGIAVRPPPAPVLSPELRERYQLRKAEALDKLEHVVRTGAFSEAELEEVRIAMHKLAGTAGMFGEAELGNLAIDLEDGIRDWPEDERKARIAESYQAIKKAG